MIALALSSDIKFLSPFTGPTLALLKSLVLYLYYKTEKVYDREAKSHSLALIPT